MDYLSMIMTMLTNGTDPGKSRFLLKKNAEKNAELLIDAVANYSMAHQELFGKYEGELMHPPEPYLLYHNLSGTFQDFLERQNLTILTPFFELLHTAHGYGYLDEVGAIYGLMRNTPELVISAALRLLEADADPYSFYAFKEGFEKIWTTIVEKEEMDIVYNANIVNIARSPLGTYIHHTMGDGLHISIDWCDFLIWTPPMTEMLKKLSTAATHEEHHYFGHLYNEIYSVSLMSSNSPFEGEEEAFTYYRDNIVDKTNHGVICDLSISNVFDGKSSKRIKRSYDNLIEDDVFEEEKGFNSVKGYDYFIGENTEAKSKFPNFPKLPISYNRVKRNWDNFAKLKNRGGKRQGRKQTDKKTPKKKSSKQKSKDNGKWETSSKIKESNRNKSGSKRNGRNRKQNSSQKSKDIGKWEENSKIKGNTRNKSGSKRNGRNRKGNKKQVVPGTTSGFGRVNSIQDIIDQDDEWSQNQKSRNTNVRKGKKSQFRQSNRGQNQFSGFRRPSTPNRSPTRNGRTNSFGRNSRPRQGRQNGGGRGGSGGKDYKVVYQIGKNYTSEAHLNNKAKDYFVEGFEHEDVELFNTISWPYFHRWTAHEVMKGNHWDVFSLQGVYRTWYAGASVSFESVKSVLEYNNLLLRQMIDPYEKLPIKHDGHPGPHPLPYADHTHPGHPKHPLYADYSRDHHPKIHHPIDHGLVEHAKHLLHADIQHPIHPHKPLPVDHAVHHHPHHPHADHHAQHPVHPHHPHADHHVQHPVHPHTPTPVVVQHHGYVKKLPKEYPKPHAPSPVVTAVPHHHAHPPYPQPSIGPHLPSRHPHQPHVPHPHDPHATPHLEHHLTKWGEPRPTPYENSHNYYPHHTG